MMNPHVITIFMICTLGILLGVESKVSYERLCSSIVIIVPTLFSQSFGQNYYVDPYGNYDQEDAKNSPQQEYNQRIHFTQIFEDDEKATKSKTPTIHPVIQEKITPKPITLNQSNKRAVGQVSQMPMFSYDNQGNRIIVRRINENSPVAQSQLQQTLPFGSGLNTQQKKDGRPVVQATSPQRPNNPVSSNLGNGQNAQTNGNIRPVSQLSNPQKPNNQLPQGQMNTFAFGNQGNVQNAQTTVDSRPVNLFSSPQVTNNQQLTSTQGSGINLKPGINQISPVSNTGQDVQKPPSVTSRIQLDANSVAIGNFGLNFLTITKQMQRQNGLNVVISPVSIASVLALIQQGARGNSERELTETLRITPENSSAAFQKYVTALKRSSNILKMATNVFVSKSFTLEQRFKSSAIQNFNSEVTTLDFRNSQRAAYDINNWVAMKTNNKITELISPDGLGPNTELVLVNAIHFKALWEKTFNPNKTLLRQFRLADGQMKDISFMRLRSMFKYGIDEPANLQYIIMPFQVKEYSMMFLMPVQNDNVDNIIRRLDTQRLSDYHNVELVDVELEVPKFSVRADIDLAPILQRMGIKEIFTTNSNLGAIGQEATGYAPQVSSATHTAVLSIDEKGGSAAAATGFGLVALSYDEADVILRIDTPFLAILWDNNLHLPLFMARIEDPSQ